jgi:TolA-binding protein
MSPRETPESLLRFFEALDTGGTDEKACEIHYGCRCIVGRGRKAAEMLVTIQKILGIPTPPESKAPPAPADQPEATPPDAQSRIAELEGAVAAEKDKSDRLLKQNLKLADENARLALKIQDLHRQINRLHDRAEMASLLERMNKQETRDQTGGEGAEFQVVPEEEIGARPAADEPASAATEPPADEPQKKLPQDGGPPKSAEE